MSISKPRIRPKTDPRCRSGKFPLPPLGDSPVYPERDPPTIAERSLGVEQGAAERVIFREDDCLR